jgi:choline dehydrogenase-like flavoprotein
MTLTEHAPSMRGLFVTLGSQLLKRSQRPQDSYLRSISPSRVSLSCLLLCRGTSCSDGSGAGAYGQKPALPANKPNSPLFQRLVDCNRLLDGTPAVEIIDYFNEEISPGPKVRSREEIKSFLREQVQTYLHMSASAPMGLGDDPRPVVDENGKVRRVDGLYVGDATIMPDTPSVAINPTTILIAEIAADRIKAASS